MREILFRGKIEGKNEWIKGDLFHYAKSTRKGIRYFDNLWGYQYKIVEPETVGQYTGLTDRDEEKIFEGDILKTEISGSFFNLVVEFKNGEYLLTSLPKSKNSFQLNLAKLYNEIEIVGNIHDNKEFLE